MSRKRAVIVTSVLTGAVAIVAALACGEVPTLPDDIAYISPVLLPAPAVALGDTLRDSTGQAAPLRLYGIGRTGDTIQGIEPFFVVTTVPGKSVTLTPENYVLGDTLRAAQIVGRVGTRLQTPPITLDVVLQPDSIASASETTAVFPIPDPGVASSTVNLSVNVSSGASGTRKPVKGIIVRYAVTAVYPEGAVIPDTTLVLVNESSRFTGPTGRTSVDTTDGSGNASRRIRAVPFGFDSVEISASANNLKGIPLRGSPIRFVVSTK